MTQRAMFEGLVFDPGETPVTTAVVAGEAFYIIDDDGFMRHISAEEVDRQVLAFFLQQLEDNKDMAVEQAMTMLGKDDLMTKAAIDSQLRNLDMDQIISQGIPEQARNMLGMLGFRILIDYQGEVIKIDQPAAPDEQ